MKKDVKVSVAMITYNHEDYIAQAIESVLAQKVSFQIELIIGEDCSLDRTNEIAEKYAAAYPNLIRLFVHAHNVGMQRNFVHVLQACSGQFVACLEGDDYWTDPFKLQRQVEFLESHPDCSMCHHRVRTITAVSGESTYEYPLLEDRVPFQGPERFMVLNYVQTCAVLLRRDLLPQFDGGFMRLPIGDHPLFVLVAQHGLVGYVDNVMAHYRIHSTGTYSAMSRDRRIQSAFDVFSYLAACSQLCRRLRKLALRRKSAGLADHETSIVILHDSFKRLVRLLVSHLWQSIFLWDLRSFTTALRFGARHSRRLLTEAASGV